MRQEEYTGAERANKVGVFASQHEPFQHCPVLALQNHCSCSIGTEENFENHGYACTPRWKVGRRCSVERKIELTKIFRFQEITGYKTPSIFSLGD
jgi:hypothetical protein